MKGRLGVELAGVLPVADMIEVAKFAEERGLQAVFTTDHTPRDAYTPLTAIATATTRISVGTGIASVYTRDPATTASMATTIDEICHGRLILGLGTGGWHIKRFGISLRNPVRTLTEYFEIVRRAISGGPFSYSGQIYNISNWDLGVKPLRRSIPLYLGGMGPNLIRLAGQIAEGLFLGALNPLNHVKYAIERSNASCKAAGRNVSKFDSAAAILTSVAKTSAEAKKRMKLGLAFYISFPLLGHIVEGAGFARERAKVADSFQRGEVAEAASYVTDEMVDAFTISGTAEECRNKLDEYRAVGLKLPCVYAYLADSPRLKKHFLLAISALTD